MNDERRRILNLVAQGKITVEEAEQLLSAIGTAQESTDRPVDSQPQAEGSRPGKASSPAAKFLRVEVRKTANQWHPDKQVTIRIPIAVVRGGMRLGAVMHGFGGDEINEHLRKRGIDLSKLNPEEIDAILKVLGELTVDVDHGKAQVRITCE